MPRTPFNVIFVCLGNICRSPAGENIFRHQVVKAGLEDQIHIDSAGTHDYHPGKVPDQRMAKTLNDRSIKSDGSGRQFKSVDLQKFDLILTMDRENHDNITALDPEGKYRSKIRPFTDFCVQSGHQVPDVPDPYYGGDSGFELVADMLEDGCQQVLAFVRKSL